MSLPSIPVGNLLVGPGNPCCLVAELSANHNGDLQRALETIRAAAKAGANAIKFQTYTADTLTIDSDREEFIVPAGSWKGRKLYDLYREAHTPWGWHQTLFAEARRLGLEAFSTPFDKTAIDLLSDLETPAYKIASFELVDDALLQAVAKQRKPVILSTGMATLEEIQHAVDTLRSHGCHQLIVLRCTSAYPAPDNSMNLRSIPHLAEATECVVGLSDHSFGTTAAVVAVSLGASMIEKHFTLDRRSGGVDSAFSLEPLEFSDMTQYVRQAEAMLGNPTFGRGLSEEGSVVFRRSLFVVRDMEEGEVFTEGNLRSIRPGYGLAPRHLNDILGRQARVAIRKGTPMSWELME